MEMARNAEIFPPQLEKFDAWGRKLNRLHLSEGWKFFHKESAVEGLIALPYESNSLGEHARIIQASKLYMFQPSSGMYSCPLAMTDGASYVLRGMLRRGEKREEIHATYAALTSRDPEEFITSGQWMTEKKGGSDVSYGTDTIALKGEGDQYKLYGYKWFTSATDSSIALTLGRISPSLHEYDVYNTEQQRSDSPLSMFLVKMRTLDKHGNEVLNGIDIVRLKDKMGTKQLPTAELVLDGTTATLISEAGKGVRSIAPMLHITRYHNALGCVGYMRRMVNLAKDYSRRRFAFGKRIIDHPLHVRLLRSMELDTQGNLLFCMEAARLLGRSDAKVATETDGAVLRVMSSLLKLFTAREAVRVTTEGTECFGGVGIMENSQIPAIVRDVLILPIWEGTTNILCLDLLRAARREPQSLLMFRDYLNDNIRGGPAIVREMIDSTFNYLATTEDPVLLEFNARKLAFNLSRAIVVSLVIRMRREGGSAKWTNLDDALLSHWLKRFQHEFEDLSDPFDLEEYERFKETLDVENMGNDEDSRGRQRSAL